MAECYRPVGEKSLEVCAEDALLLRALTAHLKRPLHYSSPAHGGWGVVRMGHLLPESYQLFVSPAACGRHGAIGAYMQGRKQRVSYLYLEEDDIVSGGYEELIADAAIELLEHLEHAGKLPKVLMIFVSCIDDLLGTDHEAIVQTLSEKRPDVRFTFCHMNPISHGYQCAAPGQYPE